MLFLLWLASKFGDFPCRWKRVRVASSVEASTLEKGPAFGEDFIATSDTSCAMLLVISHRTRLFTRKTLFVLKCHDYDDSE